MMGKVLMPRNLAPESRRTSAQNASKFYASGVRLSLVPRPLLSPARITYSIRTGRFGLAQRLHISCSAGMQALSGCGR